nr:hypothetical protein [Tanacetum cinerariifolium]
NGYDKNGTNPSKTDKTEIKMKSEKKSTVGSQQKVKPDKVEAEEIKMPRKMK